MFLEKMFSKCWDLVQAADVEVHYGDMHDFVSNLETVKATWLLVAVIEISIAC